VYPGATEEECIPVLEKESNLVWKKDFFVGYSPERINPGDKEHSLQKVTKVVSGDSEKTTNNIASIYKMVCSSGIYVAENIKTAEAAKVIENTQRDLNIALMNELALICHRIGINTNDVIKAASTKWNFLPFTPGLVGGHCIGVDPYYLVYKAEQVGYHPEVITAGRRVNDFMSEYVADETIKGIAEVGKEIKNSKILIMGLTFKENVADYRNSRIALTTERLQEFGAEVFGYDPFLDEKIITEEFHIKPIRQLADKFDAIIISAPHSKFKDMESSIIEACNGRTIIFDLKGIFPEFKLQENLTYKTL
jgi:UDP-N-acetyl-D-galactosamine dehydrogenase